jgi:serpin B
MVGGTGLPSAITGGYQAVQLPYAGGRFAALAIMPAHGTPADFVRGLTPARLTAIVAGTRPGSAVLLPRFTLTSTLDLVPALTALGSSDAFGAQADLSALSPQPTFVDQVVQRDYLAVGERGTTAAAVTGIAIAVSGRAAPARQVVLDRPFLFLVRDTTTGAILFAAQVSDPTAR